MNRHWNSGDLVGASAPSFFEEKVNANDAVTVYQKIKNVSDKYPNDSVIVDFTGGTKAMVGGAALAASILKAPLVYVGSSNYLKNLKRPDPGSEFLTHVADPYEVFGDRQEQEGIALANSGEYQAAAQVLGELYNEIPDSPNIRARYLLVN
ncbi:MAG: hypothetical protein ACTSU5_19085, partial [Promethearchaeota archaeon]